MSPMDMAHQVPRNCLGTSRELSGNCLETVRDLSGNCPAVRELSGLWDIGYLRRLGVSCAIPARENNNHVLCASHPPPPCHAAAAVDASPPSSPPHPAPPFAGIYVYFFLPIIPVLSTAN